MPIPAMSLAVVGAAYKNEDGSDRKAEIGLCEIGEPVDLIPDPDNKFDRHAVAVYSAREVQIGYITAERAPRIKALLGSTEVKAIFHRPSDFGAWVRVAFDGEEPILTSAMLADDEQLDVQDADHSDLPFYPDEIWPDD